MKREGPKLRIETLASEGASAKPMVKTPTTPTPVLHKDTQLIPIELLDNTLKDPRLTKEFPSSIYFDISSKIPLVLPMQTLATSKDGVFINCSERIPWRIPLKVDFVNFTFSKLMIEPLQSPTVPADTPKPTVPSRPTDPRKRTLSSVPKPTSPSLISPKNHTPSVFDQAFASQSGSPNAGTSEHQSSTPKLSPVLQRNFSSDTEPTSPELSLDIYSNVVSNEQSGNEMMPAKQNDYFPDPYSSTAAEEKPSPSGLAPFVLPAEHLSPTKADMESQEFGKFSNKPKTSLSIDEYMKRRKSKPSDVLSEVLKPSQFSNESNSGQQVFQEAIGQKSPSQTENEPFPDAESSSMPSIRDLFKDPTASPFL